MCRKVSTFAHQKEICAISFAKNNDMEQSFNACIEESIRKFWNFDALTDYKGVTLQYQDVARKIEKLHILFEEGGIAKGD